MEKHARRATKKSAVKSGVEHIPLLEWIVAAIGLVLVAGTALLLAWQGYANRAAPPDVSVRVETIAPIRNGYVVTVRALNAGGTTAAAVKIEAELVSASGVAEASETTFQYLPPHSARTGGIFFRKDPRLFEIRLTPKGYESP